MQIYKLEAQINDQEELVYADGMDSFVTLCRFNPDHAARVRRPSPLRLVFLGTATTDVMWTPYCEPIVSTELAEQLINSNFQGVSTAPVVLENTTGEERSEDYSELRCIGWGGMAPGCSGIRVLEHCPHCSWRVYSEYTVPSRLFDVDRWDGSDFFVIWPLSRYVFVTEAVKAFFEMNKLSGVGFRPLHELEATIAGTLTPDNIHDRWFTPECARRYEEIIDETILKEYT
jgi:hypothetical protein